MSFNGKSNKRFYDELVIQKQAKQIINKDSTFCGL